jgi:hypothetical protein
MPGITGIASAAVASVPAPPTKITSEANPHFIGRLKPTKHTVLLSLRQNADIPAIYYEANPHFLGKFHPTRFGRPINSANYESQDDPTYFIGKFHPTTITRFRYNTWEEAPPVVVEANPHFIGRLTPTRFMVLPLLRQRVADNVLVVADVVEAADAVDHVFNNVIPPQPCPCAPIAGPGPGSNQVVSGPGAGSNTVIDGPGPGSNIVVNGPGPCDCD